MSRQPISYWIANMVLATASATASLACFACGSGEQAVSNPPRLGAHYLELQSLNARACDVLFKGVASCEATFAPAVRGTTLRRGDGYAVAFTLRKDTPLHGGVLWFEASDGGACDFKLASATCYDREGRSVAGTSLRF